MSNFKERTDRLGRAFVMPSEEFIEVANENISNGYYNVSKIADKFEVCVEDVIKRGKELNLWDDNNVFVVSKK